MKKITNTFALLLLFITLLVIIFYIHMNFLKVNVVFYATLADGVIATVAMSLVLFISRHFEIFNFFEKFQFVIIFFLISYALSISIPTVIDRSLSFYILEKLQQRGGGITQKSFEEVFTKEYVKEHRLVDVRLTEQLESGTIIIRNGCVLLTKKGVYLASFSRAFRKNWLPKERLLLGEFSADLTDPFAKNTLEINYKCN